MSLSLSKSKYCNAIQCPKMLWMSKNMPEKYDDSVMSASLLETGNQVGQLAKGLLGKYVEVDYSTDFPKMLSDTKAFMDAGEGVIAEASFSYNGLFCRVDLLERNPDGSYNIFEVKSSTTVKDIFIHDASFQCFVMIKLGYEVRKVSIVHINNQYVRKGALNIKKLFTIADITKKAKDLHNFIIHELEFLEGYIKQSSEPPQDIHTGCFSPYSCGFWKYCSRNLPVPSVFDIAGLSLKNKIELYEKGKVSFSDLVNHALIKNTQELQVSASLYSKPPIIEQKEIKHFLSTLSYPLCFLDFETFQTAVPQLDGTKPYAQIPFQYSLHVIEAQGGPLRHFEFLAEAGIDPRRQLAEQLIHDMPQNACVIAYNMSFEQRVLRELESLYPDLAPALKHIHRGMKDLMTPFQKRQYYDKAMQGSYSIKAVLPALFPDDPTLNYANLESIHSGDEAMSAFATLSNKTADEVQTIRSNLLKYCKLDTYAMVKIWEKLIECV